MTIKGNSDLREKVNFCLELNWSKLAGNHCDLLQITDSNGQVAQG